MIKPYQIETICQSASLLVGQLVCLVSLLAAKWSVFQYVSLSACQLVSQEVCHYLTLLVHSSLLHLKALRALIDWSFQSCLKKEFHISSLNMNKKRYSLKMYYIILQNRIVWLSKVVHICTKYHTRGITTRGTITTLEFFGSIFT